jgi:hypothetical protein
MVECPGNTCPMTGENERKAGEYIARRDRALDVRD